MKSLSTLILCPLVGACVILFIPHKYSRTIQGLALIVAGINLSIAVQMYASFDIPLGETIECYSLFTHKSVTFDFTGYSVYWIHGVTFFTLLRVLWKLTILKKPIEIKNFCALILLIESILVAL